MKRQVLFVCQKCGYETPRWLGKCPSCAEWNSLVETIFSPREQKSKIKDQRLRSDKIPILLKDVKLSKSERLKTGMEEFDNALGGGLIPGQVVLLAGEPGIGKSTLLLQIAAKVNDKFLISNDKLNPHDPSTNDPENSPEANNGVGQNRLEISPVLYISGEESPQQMKLRAARLGIKSDHITLFSETDLESIIDVVRAGTSPARSSLDHKSGDHKGRPYDLIIIDSIQALQHSEIAALSGSVVQVRTCARLLAELAKRQNFVLILVGHITKDGTIAGPKVLEHVVDTVLYMGGEKIHAFRLLRVYKNRFGPTNTVGVFEMGGKGLKEVTNPSDAFLRERLKNEPGSVVTVISEGERPILVEIQALLTPTSFSFPKRAAQGIDFNRLLLIAAVLSSRLKFNLLNYDLYVNVAGGLKISDVGADLGVALSIISMRQKKALEDIAVFGEVGLSGEIRRVPQLEARIREAERLGYKKVLGPHNVKTVREAVESIFR